MLFPLAFIAFWPSPVDQSVRGDLKDSLLFLHGIGVPGWFGYELIEMLANIVLFMPLGFAGYLSSRTFSVWLVSAIGLFMSGSIELGQLVFLHQRFASVWDMLSNSFGAGVGAYLACLILKRNLRAGGFAQRAASPELLE